MPPLGSEDNPPQPQIGGDDLSQPFARVEIPHPDLARLVSRHERFSAARHEDNHHGVFMPAEDPNRGGGGRSANRAFLRGRFRRQ